MRKLKILALILYTLILVILLYLAYKAWQTPLITIYLTLIGLWIAGVTTLSRIYDWLFHEDTEGKRRQKEKLEQEQNKRREELKTNIHEHNQKLINTVIKPWYEDKFVSVVYEPFTTEHLQTGYANILKLRQDWKNLKDELSSEENTIKEYIKNKLAPDVPPFGFGHNFTVENVEMIIYKEIETILKNGYVPENYTAHLTLFGYHVEDHNEKYLVDKKEIFRKRIETIIKDKTVYDKFETISNNRKLSNQKTDEFYQGLKQIEHDFKERHVELKGTCKDCKDWHDELESL